MERHSQRLSIEVAKRTRVQAKVRRVKAAVAGTGSSELVAVRYDTALYYIPGGEGDKLTSCQGGTP